MARLHLDHHVFVCANRRPDGHPKGSCGERGSAAIALAFGDERERLGLRHRVRINTTSCLGACEHGPAVVVYPAGTWYGGVRVEDVGEIVAEHLLAGRPVDRLRMPE